MKSYSDLIVWQKSMNLITLIYAIILKFPDDEKYGLISQIKRSAIYKKDYSRFLQIARGSLFENQTQLEIAINLDFIKTEDLQEIKELSIEVEKMLNSLIKKLEE